MLQRETTSKFRTSNEKKIYQAQEQNKPKNRSQKLSRGKEIKHILNSLSKNINNLSISDRDLEEERLATQ